MTDYSQENRPIPQLDAEQFSRVVAYGVPQDVHTGDVVFRPGDEAYDFIVIEHGWVDIFIPAGHSGPEEAVATYGPGSFLGELNLLTGQTVYLTARMQEDGRIHRVSPDQFRRLMADDPEVSDVLLRTFLLRRDLLRTGSGARAIEIIGSNISAESLRLRTYAARQRLPHLWWDADTPAGQALMELIPVTVADLPVVLTAGRTLLRATPGRLAAAVGLSYRQRRPDAKPIDLTIVGSGPAGLAAAVYGASEGLNTLLLDAVGVGGQAAASSRIENYLGFPSGVSGAELTQRAAAQALKFGAQLSSPSEVVALEVAGAELRVVLADWQRLDSRAVLVATGARYRGLSIDQWQKFEGAGIYYAATDLEARACAAAPVTVVGGANSAGQAALFLAGHGCTVTVAVRGPDIAAQMSSYLVDRLYADPRITVACATEVTALSGKSSLDTLTLTDRTSGTSIDQVCSGLFCFIGAEPATAWLDGVTVDAGGFIPTDVQLGNTALDPTWHALGRLPLPCESSVPCVFAAGDVRVGSMKRVAAAVGEGASAVRSVHAAIGQRY